MRVLSLDQAPVNTGWAVGSPDMKAPTAGLFRMRSWGDDEDGRCHEYIVWLEGMCERYQPTHIFREQLFPITDERQFMTVAAQHMIVGLIAATAKRFHCEYRQVLVADWRKRFLGTSKALPGLKGDKARRWFKEQAVVACARRGWDITQEDAAEACGILDYGLASIDRDYAGRTDVIFRRAEHQRDHAEAS